MILQIDSLEKDGFPVFIRNRNSGTWVLTILNPISGYPAMPVLIQPDAGLTMNIAIAYDVNKKKKSVIRLCSRLNEENDFARFILDDCGTLLLEYNTSEKATTTLVMEMLFRFSVILHDALPFIFQTLYGGIKLGF